MGLWQGVLLSPLTALQLCKVCSDNSINVVLVPCGHMCLCNVCAGKLRAPRASCRAWQAVDLSSLHVC